MGKSTNKFHALHEQLNDCLEYLATYGFSALNEQEQLYAKKIALLLEEYVEVLEDEDANYERDLEDEDEE